VQLLDTESSFLDIITRYTSMYHRSVKSCITPACWVCRHGLGVLITRGLCLMCSIGRNLLDPPRDRKFWETLEVKRWSWIPRARNQEWLCWRRSAVSYRTRKPISKTEKYVHRTRRGSKLKMTVLAKASKKLTDRPRPDRWFVIIGTRNLATCLWRQPISKSGVTSWNGSAYS
jgi:hypothetical protein